MTINDRIAVLHVVDAMGADEHIWGKERVVHDLMREQRASGAIEARLATFTPGRLAALAGSDGFEVECLSRRARRVPLGAMLRLARSLTRRPVDVVHSHGYKANVVTRVLRLMGLLRARLISTCHGWPHDDPKLGVYNALDRWSCGVSDCTTVPDRAMLRRFPRWARTAWVPNGVGDAGDGAPDGRPPLDRDDGAFVVGTLGRINAEKGIPELLEAARRCDDRAVRFVVAGAGELVERVRTGPDNVEYVGYVNESGRYLRSLDVYLQASHNEGLSMSLLEAMRAGVPIVATKVGATPDVIRDGEEGLLVEPGQPDRLLGALMTLRRDPALAARLARTARQRYAEDFGIRRQHERFLELYAPL